jgi:hypothetical protein
LLLFALLVGLLTGNAIPLGLQLAFDALTLDKVLVGLFLGQAFFFEAFLLDLFLLSLGGGEGVRSVVLLAIGRVGARHDEGGDDAAGGEQDRGHDADRHGGRESTIRRQRPGMVSRHGYRLRTHIRRRRARLEGKRVTSVYALDARLRRRLALYHHLALTQRARHFVWHDCSPPRCPF